MLTNGYFRSIGECVVLQAETCGTNIHSHKKAGTCVKPDELQFFEQILSLIAPLRQGKEKIIKPVPIVYRTKDGKKWSLVTKFDYTVSVDPQYHCNLYDVISDMCNGKTERDVRLKCIVVPEKVEKEESATVVESSNKKRKA